MKRLLTLALLTLVSCALLSAPGDKRYTVKLIWDAYDWAGETANAGFVLYERVGVDWVPVVQLPALAIEVTLTNIPAGVHTYALSATNWWGESELSGSVNTPRYPGKPINLKLGE